MKTRFLLLSILLVVGLFHVQAQSTFSKTDYENFLKQNSAMTYDEAAVEYPLPQTYYKNSAAVDLHSYNYFDSLITKYSLTAAEQALIEKNGFMVSERMSYPTFVSAFRDIFHNDMPVFLSTDAVLFALHASYDNILKDMETTVMEPNIEKTVDALYAGFPALKAKYQSNATLRRSLADIDLYITVARSLTYNDTIAPQDTLQTSVDSVLTDVANEGALLGIDLFGPNRNVDFSQFTPRGHYLDSPLLTSYFKTMMWLGRIDFWLTNPDPLTYTKEDIKRMTYDALLLNELLQTTKTSDLLNENDKIISFLVGKADNLTPNQLTQFVTDQKLTSFSLIEDSVYYSNWYAKLDTSIAFEQQIMSDLAYAGTKSPVSYRLMGQRFIIDSYVFSKLTYDRLPETNTGDMRLMPKPFDISYVFGNNNALPMLESDIKTFEMAKNIVALRKTVDGYDSTFWAQTSYNIWFQSIRDLNPIADTTNLPFFMTSVGWQHEKMNTQLASWTQLRHDNLLYAKQSYTSMIVCSFPNSYVEPYPKMYKHIKEFAQNANSFFEVYNQKVYVSSYFNQLIALMDTLESISNKELQRECLSTAEVLFLRKMIKTNLQAGCGPIEEYVSGWYLNMIYNNTETSALNIDPNIQETVIADVHTQPTDKDGNVVGNVLHVATGKVNLGVFMANAPLPDGRKMAFIGPVMTYYEDITSNFKRHTDQEWRDSVAANNIPSRPGWTSVYLANNTGATSPAGLELPSKTKAWNDSTITYTPVPKTDGTVSVSPNPMVTSTNVFTQFSKTTTLDIEVFDINGRIVYQSKGLIVAAGSQNTVLPVASLTKGIYFCSLSYNNTKKTVKLIKY